MVQCDFRTTQNWSDKFEANIQWKNLIDIYVNTKFEPNKTFNSKNKINYSIEVEMLSRYRGRKWKIKNNNFGFGFVETFESCFPFASVSVYHNTWHFVPFFSSFFVQFNFENVLLFIPIRFYFEYSGISLKFFFNAFVHCFYKHLQNGFFSFRLHLIPWKADVSSSQQNSHELVLCSACESTNNFVITILISLNRRKILLATESAKYDLNFNWCTQMPLS